MYDAAVAAATAAACNGNIQDTPVPRQHSATATATATTTATARIIALPLAQPPCNNVGVPQVRHQAVAVASATAAGLWVIHNENPPRATSKSWQTPSQFSPSVAAWISKRKAPKEKGTLSREGVALVTAALHTAKAVEIMAKAVGEKAWPALSPVSNDGGHGGEAAVHSGCSKQGFPNFPQATAKFGRTLPLSEHAVPGRSPAPATEREREGG